jgi:hypothetical protein
MMADGRLRRSPKPTQQLSLGLPTITSDVPDTLLRVDAARWNSINVHARADLSQPRGDATVQWHERGAMMEARVSSVVAETLRGMCDALGVTLHEESARGNA